MLEQVAGCVRSTPESYWKPSRKTGFPTPRPGYTGQVKDAVSGMNYMQQRYYDPLIGRFLSVDPVTAYAKPGINFNRYWYANDNPYKFTDPDGRATVYSYEGKIVVVQTFNNNGTQFTDDEIKAQGAALSGTASDGTIVEVRLVPGNDKDAMQINPNSKLNDRSQDPANRSHIDKLGGRKIEIAPNAQSSATVGHEIGHGLKAEDQYKVVDANGKVLKAEVPGGPSLMKTATGTANTQSIDEIQKGASSRSNTQVNCTKGTKAGCE